MKRLSLAIIVSGLFIILGGINNPALSDDEYDDIRVLTDSSPDETVASNQNMLLYGSSGVNQITLESGAKASIRNSAGNNRIIIESSSELFTVSRAGTTVTFKGSDGTVLKIPATTLFQQIIFHDFSFNLMISYNEILLDDQVVDIDEAPITATERISGFVYESDGVTPIANVCVNANTAPACDHTWAGGSQTDENGYYAITVSPGVYAISTDTECGQSQDLGYVDEWYDGDQGVMDCESAAEIDVSDGSNATGINFYLDEGVTISGYVYEEDGVTPIANVCVNANSAPACDYSWVAGNSTDENGYYSILVPPDVYYIFSNPDCGESQSLNFENEWYDGDQGTRDCESALGVDVSDGNKSTNINFYMEPKSRLNWTYVATVFDDELNGGFQLASQYTDLLEGAVLTGPNSFSEAFDLVVDLDLYLNFWWKSFGSNFSYGDYTLTITFSDGVEEVFHQELIEVEVLPVAGDSVTVTLNANGNIDVEWQAPSAEQLYQVRIYDDDGRRYYNGSSGLGLSSWTIPAEELGELVIGSTYYVQVRTFDEDFQHVKRGERHYFTHAYMPPELRVNWADVARVYDGELNSGFELQPAYTGLLESAVLTGPNSFSEAFDLIADFEPGWNDWWKNFGSNFSYGDYTLTITFSDGVEEVFHQELIEVEVLPVAGDSVTVTLNANGNIDVEWEVPSAEQLYRVDIYDDDGPYYKGNSGLGISSWTIPAEDLGDLVIGSTYYVQVRTFDEEFQHVERGERHYFTYLYE